MKVLVYRYGNICEPDIIEAFGSVGIEVVEEKTEILQKSISDFQRLENVKKIIEDECPFIVFSINFYPVLAKVCHIYGIYYFCWTVDSPMPELYSKSVRNRENRIFLFDKEQYERFSKYNAEGIYHLPLAGATNRFDSVITNVTASDRQKYSSSISFVGSLYNEKDILANINGLSEQAKGYIRALKEATFLVPDYSIIENAICDEMIEQIKNSDSDMFELQDAICTHEEFNRYMVANKYVGISISTEERIRTLNTLAKYFDVDLYTRSDTAMLDGVNVHGGVGTLDEMPKIFNLSKINLNMTIKPIQKGIPLRVFDICGCGGFAITNYQEELEEVFEIGTDLESYCCLEELIEKCDYYLANEDIRAKIALNGYKKVKEQHTYFHRISSMLKTVI